MSGAPFAEPDHLGARYAKAYVAFVLRNRVGVLVACGALTLVALLSLSRATIASSVGNLFLGESPAYQRYLERAGRFGNDEVLFVGVEDPAVLTAAGQERLGQAVDAVRAFPGVQRVFSVLDARRLEPGPLGTPVPASVAGQAKAEPQRAEELLRALRDDPLTGGVLVARDLRSTAVVIELTPDGSRPAEVAPQLVRAVRAAFAAAGYAPDAIHPTGLIALIGETLDQTNVTLQRLLPLVAVILLIVVWLMFRRLWPAAVSLGVALLAMCWTLGFAVQLDRQISILMAMVPAVVVIVSFADIVHLCSAYLLELGEDIPQGEAILAAGADVGAACILTSLTTFVGFVGLSFVPAPAFRILGVVLGFGVAVALLLAITLVPVIFSLMGRPKPLRGGTTATVHRVLDAGLAAAERTAVRFPWAVIGAFAALCVVCGVGVARLRIETDFGRRLTADNPVRRDLTWFQERFAGTNSLDVFVDAPGPTSLEDPAWLARFAAFQDEVAAQPGVDAVVSLVDLIRAVYAVTPHSPDAVERGLPTDPAAVAGLIRLLRVAGGPDVARAVDLEAGRLRLLVRLSGGGFRETSAAGLAVERAGRQHLPRARVEATGLTFLFGDWLDEIVAGQRAGLVFSLVTIALMMIVGLGSLRVGLISMIPNLIPLLVLGGWLGWTWDQVDSDAFAIALLALGIGVDDTIHFLGRYRLEGARFGTAADAIRRTFAFAGRAIVMTTVILVAGFVPFAGNDYLTMRMFGTLLPQCLVVALLADVLLVPALIAVGWLRFPPPPARAAEAPSDVT